MRHSSETSGLQGQGDAWIAEYGQPLRRLVAALTRDEARGEDAVQSAWLAALAAPPRHESQPATDSIAARAGMNLFTARPETEVLLEIDDRPR